MELDSDQKLHIMDTAYLSFRAIGKTVTAEMCRPSVLYRPSIQIDGNKWCVLYGDNLQDGVAGFGDSPASAMADFDEQWNQSINL